MNSMMHGSTNIKFILKKSLQITSHPTRLTPRASAVGGLLLVEKQWARYFHSYEPGVL